MTRLEWLSFDVQLTILKFLEPLDILRLRRTCRTLQRTTLHRIVWIIALRGVCVRNTVFMPTFPIHDMSQSALEYAAMGPERFLRTVAAKCRLPEPRSHRIIQRKEHELEEVFIVPGGRYLVTVDTAMLAVWDLGIPGLPSPTPRSPEPISTLPAHSIFLLLLVNTTDDGRGLTTFVIDESDEIQSFTVARIYPSDKHPSLQQIAQIYLPYPLDDNTSLTFCSLSRNKVIFLVGPTLNVWDYAEDAWASIQIPHDYKEVIVSGSAILIPYPDVVLIWEMPTLSKVKPLFSGSPPSNIPPAFTLGIPISKVVDYCIGPCSWYSSSPHPLLFDFSSHHEFQRFEVVHKNENFNDSVVTTLGRYRDPNDYGLEYGRFCNDTLVSLCWWADKDRAEAHIAGLSFAADGHPSGFINSSIRFLSDLDDNAPPYSPCSFCPVSGRFAWVDKLDCVKVVDYFSESLPT